MKFDGKGLTKRIFVLLLCAAMATSAAGCNGDGGGGPKPSDSTSSGITSSSGGSNSSNDYNSFEEDSSSDSENPSKDNSTSNSDNVGDSSGNSLTTSVRRGDKPSKVVEDDGKTTEIHVEQPFRETVNIDGHTYNLVWHDEFDGSSIDYNKWGYGTVNDSRGSQIVTLTQEDDPSIVGVRDGQLQLNARRYFNPNDAAAEYAVNKAIITQDTMNFKYGYVEMYAKVPHRLGGFPAFWIQGTAGLVERKQPNYFVEIDIFENVGGTYIDSNIHKWYTGAGLGNTSSVYTVNKAENPWLSPISKLIRIPLDTNDFNTLPYEYHFYSMEWTPEYIKTRFDDTVICCLDITQAWDQNWTKPNGNNKDGVLDETLKKDMTGFHDYVFLLLQNLILIDDGETQKNVSEYTEFPFEYWIDYIRLYQDPTVSDSGLVYVDENGSVVDYYK